MSNEGYRTMTGQTRKIEFTRSHDDSYFKLTFFFFFFFFFCKVQLHTNLNRPQETRQESPTLPPPHFVYIQQDMNANGLQDREREKKAHTRGKEVQTWTTKHGFVVCVFLFLCFFFI